MVDQLFTDDQFIVAFQDDIDQSDYLVEYLVLDLLVLQVRLSLLDGSQYLHDLCDDLLMQHFHLVFEVLSTDYLDQEIEDLVYDLEGVQIVVV